MKSREQITIETISDIKDSMIGEVQKPTLFLLPMLAQIALSLAVIADEMRKRGHDEQD